MVVKRMSVFNESLGFNRSIDENTQTQMMIFFFFDSRVCAKIIAKKKIKIAITLKCNYFFCFFSLQRPDGFVGILGAARPAGQMLGGLGAVVVPSRRSPRGVPADGRQRRPRVPRLPETGPAERRPRAVGQRAAPADRRVRLPVARRAGRLAAPVPVLQERRRHGRVLRGGGQDGRPVRSRPVPLRPRAARRAHAPTVRRRQHGRR